MCNLILTTGCVNTLESDTTEMLARHLCNGDSTVDIKLARGKNQYF